LHRTNEAIRAPELRVVLQENGEDQALGIMSREKALAMAKEKEVDLVEISPKAKPPVCKIVDYGKMLYALKKKEQQAKKATKSNEMKGIRLTFRIGPGDLERQRQHAATFLTGGHPVRVQMMLRGREKAHRGLAFAKMKTFLESLHEAGSVDQPSRSSGFQIIAILKPLGKSKS
jgi:translation initiation factor IF-3